MKFFKKVTLLYLLFTCYCNELEMTKYEITDEDIRDIQNSIEGIQNALDNLKVNVSKIMGEDSMLLPPDWERKRLRVWAKIHEKGDVVTYENWQKIYIAVGYDPRGTGGFFAGNDSSLVWVGDDKVALSKWAVKEVEKYKEWLDKK